jgi:molybdate transport system substrate-binding protein
MAVREGAPTPDISTEAKLKKVLLNAKSIAYSDSASGVYLASTLFKKLGIADQIKSKSTMIPRTPVGESVASGQYEIGFQQVAELLPIHGITVVGKIPEKDQSVTRYAAAIPVDSKNPIAAKALLLYMSSHEAQAAVRKTGMDPLPGR